LLHALEHAYVDGELRDSLVAPIVISILSEENYLELEQHMDPAWLITGIRLSDEYFVRVGTSAGDRDWQRDFAQTTTPTLVGTARVLRRSADAHAVVIQICNALAARLRIRLAWPDDPDKYNDLTNDIYAGCLQAVDLEDDRVLVTLQGVTAVGP
jgi:hypothetical protein